MRGLGLGQLFHALGETVDANDQSVKALSLLVHAGSQLRYGLGQSVYTLGEFVHTPGKLPHACLGLALEVGQIAYRLGEGEQFLCQYPASEFLPPGGVLL